MRELIMEFLSSEHYKPMKHSELVRALGIKKQEKREFSKHVDKLIRTSIIVKTKSGRYMLSQQSKIFEGFLRNRDNKYSLDTKDGLVLLSNFKAKTANIGDKIAVKIIKKKHSVYYKIVDVIDAKKKLMIGYIIEVHRGFKFSPVGNNGRTLLIAEYNGFDLKHGYVVACELVFKDGKDNPLAKVVKVYGDKNGLIDDTALVIDKFDLPHEFSDEVKNEILFIKNDTAFDLNGREDFRYMDTVTIDGDDARDFDDGVFVQRNDDGYTLYVHIADVSYYVKPKSALDNEALRRGFSVYFPNSVIPMLPFELSNDLCSLVPGKDRPSLSVVMDISNDGVLKSYRFTKGVIRNKKRLTYKFVQAVIDLKKEADPQLKESLKLMAELAKILRKRRIKKGSLDLNIPEFEFEITEDKIVSVHARERLFAYNIIEEFMLMANLSACDFLIKHVKGVIKRVHDAPDMIKLNQVLRFFATLGYRIPQNGKITSKKLMNLINKIDDNKWRYIASMLILRSLKRAEYSTKDIAHFALNFKNYTHFTSPIRRYPDLVIHRLIVGVLDNKLNMNDFDLNEIAYRVREREITTELSEFYMDDIKALDIVKNYIGDTLKGFIVSVTKNGFFVKLQRFFVEGYVDLASIKDDYYELVDERFMIVGTRTKRVFKIGDDVLVKIVNIDKYANRLTLEVV